MSLHIPRPSTAKPGDCLVAASDVREDIWKAIANRQAVTFLINPSDLFSADLGTASALDHRDSLPIIDAMTIHFTTAADIPGEIFNKAGFAIGIKQGLESTFVQAGGNLRFLTAKPEWRHPRVPITCGFAEDSRHFHEQRLAGPHGRGDRVHAAAGMSPFALWTLDFSKCGRADGLMAKVLDGASSMTLMFTLVSTRSHESVQALP